MRRFLLAAVLSVSLWGPALADDVVAPILSYAGRGELEHVRLALAAGADPNTRGPGGVTPLQMAALEGSVPVIELLLTHGADIEARSGAATGEQTALHAAAENGQVGAAEALLAHGAGVDARAGHGLTPLDAAVAEGQVDAAALLLARGANANAVDDQGRTPLHYAALSGSGPLINLLLRYGANSSARDASGRAPYDLAQASDKLDAQAKATLAHLLAPAAAPASPTSCWDYRSIAADIRSRNPSIDNATLAVAVEKAQELMGCRQPPMTTECRWVGNVWTCSSR